MQHATILAHQFDDLEQQKEAVTLGMWAFLATEVMFFGGAFAAYSVYRAFYPEAFAAASRLEDWKIGAFNTAVLLCSSLTVALAVHQAQLGDNRGVVRFLLLTCGLAMIFIAIKGYEYSHIIQAGHAPWQRPAVLQYYAGENPTPLPGEFAKPMHLFFSFYFAMTAIHATHMLVGIGLFAWLIFHARRNYFSPENHNAVECVGLYWHFVDIVWIFLYPLFYLIDPVF